VRIVFFGSGAFGLPTLWRLHAQHDVALVVSQPDRPAGRKRLLTPTPVSAWALDEALPLERCDDANLSTMLHSIEADVWVVIAFGQKLSDELLGDRFAVNLHGSLLPRWRGAAPIHHAVMAGDARTGVSVITLSNIMDGGAVLGSASVPIEATTTTGALHDVLAGLGQDVISAVLAEHAAGTLQPVEQDAACVTRAPKLGRGDAWLELTGTADDVRCRINGLSPWPGCTVSIAGVQLRLLRAGGVDEAHDPVATGQVCSDGVLGCGSGSVQLLDVQPAGGRPMSFIEWANGQRLSGVQEVTV